MPWGSEPENQIARRAARKRYRQSPAGKAAKIRGQNRRRMASLDLIREEKSKRGCSVCGEKDWRCLDFHHRDPIQKLFNIATATTTAYAWERIVTEIEKCDVMCSNCHRKHHTGLGEVSKCL